MYMPDQKDQYSWKKKKSEKKKTQWLPTLQIKSQCPIDIPGPRLFFSTKILYLYIFFFLSTFILYTEFAYLFDWRKRNSSKIRTVFCAVWLKNNICF